MRGHLPTGWDPSKATWGTPALGAEGGVSGLLWKPQAHLCLGWGGGEEGAFPGHQGEAVEGKGRPPYQGSLEGRIKNKATHGPLGVTVC